MATSKDRTNRLKGISVYQRGETWSFRATVGSDPVSGERIRVNGSGFGDEESALKAAIDAREKAQNGQYIAPSRMTVADFLKDWLSSIRDSIKPSTFANYEDNIRYYVVPSIGHRRLQELSVPMLNAFYQRLLAEGRCRTDQRLRMYQYWEPRRDDRNGKGPGPTEVAKVCDVSYHAARKAVWHFQRGRVPQDASQGLAPKSVKNVHRVLHTALKDAVAWEYIDRNPAEHASLPRQPRGARKRRKQQTWTVDELASWLRLALQDRFAAMWVLAATTGMRRSELAGLERDMLDLDARVADIGPTRVVVRGRAIDEDGKSESGERLISLDMFTTAMLRKHLAMLDEEHRAFGSTYQATGKLMCWEDGRLLHPDTITSRFNLLVDRAGARRIRLHDVRHTYATLALDSGIDPKILSDRVGHANVNVTLGLYVHRSSGHDRAARNGYSTVLDKTLFEAQRDDEIILCLNYDGLYGINNINRFLQSNNPGTATTWRVSTYKVDDPVLFNETERFRPMIYNNLKGRIVGIEHAPGHIQFDVELDRPLSEFDIAGDELEWMGGSTVRFSVYEYDTSDEDDDSLNTTVPFQVAYAVSIHKAQGLEYDSVKIVITDANEDDITHNIFYTAVTRARESLRIFWTPETQQAVLNGLHRSTNSKDVALVSARRGLTPVSGSRRT